MASDMPAMTHTATIALFISFVLEDFTDYAPKQVKNSRPKNDPEIYRTVERAVRQQPGYHPAAIPAVRSCAR